MTHFWTLPAMSSAALTPHGLCLGWQPGLIALYWGADAATAVAYVAICGCLAWLIHRRPGLRYRWVAWLFAGFMLACAASHGLAAMTLFVPAYRAEGVVKLLTAVLSVGAAVAFARMAPRLLAQPTTAERTSMDVKLQAYIVEQERAAALLRENEARLLLTQEAGGIDSWEWRIEPGESWARTPSFVRGQLATETPAAWLTLDDWLAFIHPSDRRRVRRALTAALCDEIEYEEEYRVAAADGAWRWIHDRGRMLPLASGYEVRMLGVSRDVTERRELLDRLAMANAQLRQQAEADNLALQLAGQQHDLLFKNSSDGLLIIRVEPGATPGAPREFRYEALNPAGCRLVDGGDNAGRRLQDCLPAAQAEAWLTALRDCVAGGVPQVLSLTRSTAEGERQFETSLSPARDPATGVVTHIIGCSRDVTERVQMETQLRQMQRMEVTGRLTAGMAHDFNNLLQTLMGGLEMLRQEIIDLPSACEYADLALQAARRGADLTHSLLAFSRQQTLRPRPVQVDALLNSIQRLAAPMLGPGIACSVDVEDQELTAFVDSGQLEIALLNLLVNARDAMPQGGRVVLSGRAASHGPANAAAQRFANGQTLGTGRAVLVVEDSGCGMDEATASQACEPFFTTKGLRGTGLGLSMVQGFARQSGGDLRIVSNTGKGTRMELWLPAGQPVPLHPQPAALPAPQVTSRGHVMVVDDVSDVLVTVGAFLRSSGFHTTQVSNADEALAVIASGTVVDVLVTDYAMPGLNGLDLLHQAREMQPDLPGLVITGFWHLALPNELKRFMVLRKPFDRSTLVTHILALMEPDLQHASLTPSVALPQRP